MSNTNFQNLIYNDGFFICMAKGRGSFKKLMAAAFILMMVASAVIIIPVNGDSSADSSFTVKDGRGTEVTFNEPAGHIVTSGKGTTATVIQLGQLDKLVVCDSYSKTATEDVFTPLKQKIEEGKVKADGNVYSSGLAAFKTNVIDAADTKKGGTFDREKDVIVLTASAATNDTLKTYFSGEGFKKILVWDSITEYDQIIDFAKAVSMCITGSVANEVKSMELVEKTISDRLKDEQITTAEKKVKAIYVRISSGNYALGNTNSLTTSMIDAAGGNNIAFDDGKAKPTYTISPAELTQMRTDNGEDRIVVFLDTTVTEDKVTQLKTLMGTEHTSYVPLDGLWNNYSIDSKDGVWTMACAMYPDYFSGDVPTVSDGGNNNIILYAAIGGIVAVVVIVAAVFLMKRH